MSVSTVPVIETSIGISGPLPESKYIPDKFPRGMWIVVVSMLSNSFWIFSAKSEIRLFIGTTFDLIITIFPLESFSIVYSSSYLYFSITGKIL